MSANSYVIAQRSQTFAVAMEKAESNYSAYVPDLPGCIAPGYTMQGVAAEIGQAIAPHISGLCEDGAQIPVPSSQVEYIDIAA